MKEYFIKLWNALWDSTNLDEKAEAALKEAAKNVVAQSKDVVGAVRGKKRKGKKPYNKNKTNNNSKN